MCRFRLAVFNTRWRGTRVGKSNYQLTAWPSIHPMIFDSTFYNTDRTNQTSPGDVDHVRRNGERAFTFGRDGITRVVDATEWKISQDRVLWPKIREQENVFFIIYKRIYKCIYNYIKVWAFNIRYVLRVSGNFKTFLHLIYCKIYLKHIITVCALYWRGASLAGVGECKPAILY